jgi:hypothetical protein
MDERSVMSVTMTESKAKPRRRDERGEGVISAAIAVLIMAFIGVTMSRKT